MRIPRSAIVLVAAWIGLGCSRHEAPRAEIAKSAEPAEPDRSTGGAMWGANYFPNIPLVTHRGEQVRFFDDVIKDKVVAINFIYTTCTDACPMETARMLEVQKLLRDRLGKDVFFYSISIDPEHDTPEVLRAYAEAWNVGPGWTFLSGKESDITLLRKKLGVYEQDLARKDHNLSLIIGNQRTGRWMKRSPYENPYVLASQLGGWLHNWRLPVGEDRDYANAPEVRAISKGEDLFRTRCAACHTIGGGDRTGDDERIGPDLRDVSQRRAHEWLVRWVMKPDAVLAARDPVALALLAQYRNLPMPNLRLTRVETEKLLAYIDEASRAFAEPRGGGAVAEAAGLLAPYESTRAGLADDDLAAARTAAERLAVASAVTAHPELAAITGAARRLTAAPDLEAARRAFGDASQLLIGLLAGDAALRGDRQLFQCSMAPGYQKWIQTSTTVDNPYWGKRMRRCGTRLATWSN